MVKLELKGLKDGVHIKKFVIEPDSLSLPEEIFQSPIAIKTILELQGDNVSVEYSADTVAKLICDRTLEPFDYDLNANQRVFAFLKDQETTKDQTEIVEVDTKYEEIDLSENIRDTIMLAIPLRKVSPGAEEKDIPVIFGKDPNEIDERWEALRKLKEE